MWFIFHADNRLLVACCTKSLHPVREKKKTIYLLIDQNERLVNKIIDGKFDIKKKLWLDVTSQHAPRISHSSVLQRENVHHHPLHPFDAPSVSSLSLFLLRFPFHSNWTEYLCLYSNGLLEFLKALMLEAPCGCCVGFFSFFLSFRAYSRAFSLGDTMTLLFFFSTVFGCYTYTTRFFFLRWCGISVVFLFVCLFCRRVKFRFHLVYDDLNLYYNFRC